MAGAQQPPPPDYVAIGDVSALESNQPAVTSSTATTSTTTPAVDPAVVPVAPVTAPTTTSTLPPRPTVPAGRTVTAVGDSVMLGAMRALQQLGPNVTVDAAVNRQVNVGIEILTYYRDQGLLGDTVVIHLGNNGTFSAEEFDQIMDVLQGHHVVFLTVRVPGRRWQDPNNQVLVDGVNRYGNASLLDWNGLSASQPDMFYEDHIHLQPPGALFYSTLIADAV